MKKLACLMLGMLCLPSAMAAEKSRVVVIDGSLTEIVYALGAQNQLVAVDSTSLYPAAARKLPSVGYLRALSSEGILSLQPSKIITSAEAGPATTLAQLKQSGLDVHVIQEANTPEGVTRKIDDVGKLLGKTSEAATLKAHFLAQLAPLQTLLNGQYSVAKPPKVLFFLGMQGNQFMAAGSETQADSLLGLLHADNAGKGFKGYKPLNKEAVLALNPDVIVVASTLPDADKAAPKTDAYQQFSYTQAYKNKRIVSADSGLLLGFGPRLPEALLLLSPVLYPQYPLAQR